MWAATVGAFLVLDQTVAEAEDYTRLTLPRDPHRGHYQGSMAVVAGELRHITGFNRGAHRSGVTYVIPLALALAIVS
jgi:hypothetical protein